jgi:hypothetical protein
MTATPTSRDVLENVGGRLQAEVAIAIECGNMANTIARSVGA